MIKKLALLFTTLLFTGGLIAQPVTVEIVADRDNTLYEDPQGTLSSGAGPTIFSGLTPRNGTRSALVHFDLSVLPANAVITEVSLRMEVTRNRTTASTFSLRRVQADWGEGASNAGFTGGGGAAAQPGDVTWTDRFFGQELPWNNMGGDFDTATLSSTSVGDLGTYIFPSSQALVDLANQWFLDASTNFGLGVLPPGGTTPSAKQFASRENPTAALRPTLIVTYELLEVELIPISGLWFDGALPGDGFNVIQSPAGLVIFYFGYSSDGGPRWLVSETLDTPIIVGQDIVLNMLFGEAGNFQTPQDPATLADWGTITINLTDQDNGVFTLSGADGDKTFQVTKLAGITIAEPPATN